MAETEVIIEPGGQNVELIRMFDATPAELFAVLSNPELIPQWWGPAHYPTTVDLDEVWHGGRWRYVSREADGAEFAFRGVYHDVERDYRIVRTVEFEPAPRSVALEIVTLDGLGGRTKYTAVSIFDSVRARDAVVETGMADGAGETLDRLAQVVANQR